MRERERGEGERERERDRRKTIFLLYNFLAMTLLSDNIEERTLRGHP